MPKDWKLERRVLIAALTDAAETLKQVRDEEMRERLRFDVARLSLRLLQVQEKIEQHDLD